MFPTGLPGSGLLILRVTVAAMVVTGANLGRGSFLSIWEVFGGFIALGFLCLGLLTPVCCVLSLLLEGAALYSGSGLHGSLLIFSAFLTLSVSVLGPGAISLDSRMFGRRRITHS
jgi:hypothetical protein